MRKRSSLLKSIVSTVADYRDGEIDAPTTKHVETWIKQFDGEVQEAMLEELDHVLKQTYIAKATVQEFLSSLVTNKDLAGGDPCLFWKTVKFLDIQRGGNSQRQMLVMFASLLQEECDLQIDDCGGDPQAYLYLDDGIFTGNRIKNDIKSWIQSDATQDANVHVVAIALHKGGQYYAKTEIEKAAKIAGKKINVNWWRSVEVEDRKTYVDSSDVLRPTSLPDDRLTQEYVQSLKYPPILRKPGSVGNNRFFSSEEGRHLLEQELLKAGARIRSMCPYLNIYQRPLGNMVLETLGFGSLLVTFRNCPNNCPLAFWAGDPWYPLFHRKTN
jgi:hypothetical protein